MSDNEIQHNTAEEADVIESRSISKAWLVPLVALGIGAWMVYYQWANQGPLITIEFTTASGLEPEKTKIKTRDVDVGVVKKIELKPDLTGVIVTARIEASAAHLLREDSNFWIVSPRVSLSGVSGLSTLLSGPYITMEPSSNGAERYAFTALDDPPVTPAGTPGLHVTLNSDDEFAFKEGDPIVYKGLKVGEFEDIFFNLEERVVYYNAFIEAPYHKLITENTKFWNISGVRFELEASGLKVQTGSLETLLTNGVTFGVPQGMPAGRQITQRSFFDIYPDHETASEQRHKLGVNFVILVRDSIRGLQVGAPVEYRGLEIGKVLEINIRDDAVSELTDEGYAIPVLVSIQPSRVQQPDNRQGMEYVRAQTLHWIKRGFRASLKLGNVLTGALYVDLQHYPDEQPAPMQTFMGYDVIPIRESDFAQITQKVSSLLDTFNALPFEQLSTNADELINEVRGTANQISKVAESLDLLVVDVHDQAIAKNLNTTLASLNKLLTDFSSGSRGHDELLNTILDFQKTMKELTPLLQQLNQSPNSLIFADGIEPVLEPKASGGSDE